MGVNLTSLVHLVLGNGIITLVVKKVNRAQNSNPEKYKVFECRFKESF